MQIDYQHVPYASEHYWQSLALREQVLRKPLGMHTRPEDTAHDAEQLHVVAIHNKQVIATISMVLVDTQQIKLRQMAVHPDYSGKGIGAALVNHAHAHAASTKHTHITLNARDTAIGFYEKLGYQCIGEPFEEIGIIHQRMDITLGSQAR